MPIYEYVCEQPGQEPVVLELIRSSADADKPVPDPEGKGRIFRRRFSVFAAGTGTLQPGHVHSGMCGCGKRQGSCGGA
jgi:predicted nucleic acid-binding Zn ribbon protein